MVVVAFVVGPMVVVVEIVVVVGKGSTRIGRGVCFEEKQTRPRVSGLSSRVSRTSFRCCIR